MEEFISKCSSLPGSNMLMNSWAYLPKSGLHRNWRNVVDPIVTSQWCQCSIPGFRCCWHWEGFMAFAFAMMNDKPYESHVFMVTGGSPLALGHWPSDFHRNLKRTPLDFTTWIGKKSQRFFLSEICLGEISANHRNCGRVIPILHLRWSNPARNSWPCCRTKKGMSKIWGQQPLPRSNSWSGRHLPIPGRSRSGDGCGISLMVIELINMGNHAGLTDRNRWINGI